jgi:hypothetical protein
MNFHLLLNYNKVHRAWTKKIFYIGDQDAQNNRNTHYISLLNVVSHDIKGRAFINK